MNLLRKMFPGGAEVEQAPEGTKSAIAAALPETPMLSPGGVNVRCEFTIEAHAERAWMIAWHPSGNILASCSSDKTVKLWSRASRGEGEWRCISTLEGEHSRTVRCIQWSPDGEYLACSSFDATVSVWKKASDQFEMESDSMLEGHENEVKSVAWNHDGTHLATCSRDKTVWLWDRTDACEEWECCGVLGGHTQDVKCVRWAPHANILFSCGYDDTIKLWEESPSRKDDWHCTQTLVHHTSTVWEVAPQPYPLAPGAMLLASCSDDNTVAIWAAVGDEQRFCPVRTLSGVHDRTIFSIDWAPSNDSEKWPASVIGCASGDDSFSLLQLVPAAANECHNSVNFDLVTVTVQREAHSSDVNCIRFCPTAPAKAGNLLRFATCSDDGTIKIWCVDVAGV